MVLLLWCCVVVVLINLRFSEKEDHHATSPEEAQNWPGARQAAPIASGGPSTLSSSTLPLLDGNQEADEAAFLCELARANADDTAYLPCSLPSKGVGYTHTLVSLNLKVRHKSGSQRM